VCLSIGPRVCVGRNVAEMELTCIAAAVFRNVGLSSAGITEQFSEIGTPRIVNRLRVAAKAIQEAFDVSRIRAKVFGDDF